MTCLLSRTPVEPWPAVPSEMSEMPAPHPAVPAAQARGGTGLPSRPAAVPGRAGCPAASPATPGPPLPDDLTAIVFRALYAGYDLRTFGALHVVTPKGTPVFTGD